MKLPNSVLVAALAVGSFISPHLKAQSMDKPQIDPQEQTDPDRNSPENATMRKGWLDAQENIRDKIGQGTNVQNLSTEERGVLLADEAAIKTMNPEASDKQVKMLRKLAGGGMGDKVHVDITNGVLTAHRFDEKNLTWSKAGFSAPEGTSEAQAFAGAKSRPSGMVQAGQSLAK